MHLGKLTGANGDHVRIFHDTVLAYLFDEFKAAGIFFRGGPGNSTKTHFHIAFPRTSQNVNFGTSRASSLTLCSTARFLQASHLTLLTAIGTSAN